MTNAELKRTLENLSALPLDDLFLVDGWSIADTANALEVLELPEYLSKQAFDLFCSDEIADAMLERMIQAGWDYMYSAITEHLRREWRVDFTNKSGQPDSTTFSTRDAADPEALDEVLSLINEQWDELEIESVESISKGNLEIA